MLVSYIDIEHDPPVEVRRRHLLQQYKFDCDCPRCVREAAVIPASS